MKLLKYFNDIFAKDLGVETPAVIFIYSSPRMTICDPVLFD